MANSVSINSDQNNLWRGGIEPFKASYGKLMMWFFLISDAFTFSTFLIAYGVIRYKNQACLKLLNMLNLIQQML